MTRKNRVPPILADLWRKFEFTPNDAQKEAILHVDGPLFLPAGPGSGKTRVLLWRTVNLVMTHDVQPNEIFLSTFTEKAALQLKNGLRTLLSAVSARNGKTYDTGKLYVGTVHSLCRQLLMDRRFTTHGFRSKPPILLDELGQYMFLRRGVVWDAVLHAPKTPVSNVIINSTFGARGVSRHNAVTNLISFFNSLSEEMIDPDITKTDDPDLQWLLQCYEAYCNHLHDHSGMEFTDLSLLQQAASRHLGRCDRAGSIFKHVIIDEYQDTNPIQETIFFQLAGGYKNLCVVGDDDQALYRFRGATVENFVEFPERCQKRFGITPTRVILATNYRSREGIVDFYNDFIIHPTCDWQREPQGAYRVMEKQIVPVREDVQTAVVASTPGHPVAVAREIAGLVRRLLDEKKVDDPNQIAFLFPSLKSPHVERMRDALSDLGIEVYAPRAGQFLNVPEARAVFGLLFQVFGDPAHVHTDFQNWVGNVLGDGDDLMDADPFLRRFVGKKQSEVQQARADYTILARAIEQRGWSADAKYDPDTMPTILAAAPGLSSPAKKAVRSGLFDRFARDRVRDGRPFTLGYAITRATSVDWNVLDFFYQLAGFEHFKAMFDIAESGEDEGPVCNLSLISSYLARFLDHYPFPITGQSVDSGHTLRNLTNFLYILYRRGESEYEDSNDPFPKGRVPFITIHQAKGLEFPVVVMANPRKDPKLQLIEEMVEPLLTRQGEPLDRMARFDVMRMFYVALSRAKNLLVVAHYRGQGQRLFEPFSSMLNNGFPRIPQLDISTLPAAETEVQTVPKSYSYTGDFLLYRKCPRQYMLLRKYGFVPSRSQTMFFGSLVHQTLDDLHQFLIDVRRPTE